MESIQSIFEKEIFDSKDRSEILKDPRLKMLFMAAGLMKSNPQQVLSIENSYEVWEERYRTGLIESWEFEIYKRGSKGGNCDVCNKPWKKKNEIIEIAKKDSEEKEKVIIAYHYQPACYCYMRCFFCNRFLIIETKKKLDYCLYCSSYMSLGKRKDWKPVYQGCFQVKAATKTNPDGETQPTGRYKKCTGILKLKPQEHGEYSVMECSKCGYILRKRMVI